MTIVDGDVGVAVALASPLLLRGMREFLQAADGLCLAGCATDVDGIVGLPEARVCVWDAAFDDAAYAGIASIAARRPGLGVVLVSREGRPLDVSAALRAGAMAIVDRDVDERSMRDAILAASESRPLLQAGSVGSLWEQAATTARGPALTRRERQVLVLMGRGMGNKAIADELFISENTVKNHVRRVHEKLQVHSRTEAVVRAAQEGIVAIGPKGSV